MKVINFRKLIQRQQKGRLTKVEQKRLKDFEDGLLHHNKTQVFKSEFHKASVKEEIQKAVQASIAKKHNWQWTQIAASMVLAIGAVFFLTKELSAPKLLVYNNDSAKFKTIVLPDSSVVKLNKYSRLSLNENFGKEHRSVELSGEAYFQVTKNKTLPFIVQTDELYTQVVGTEFNIKQQIREIDVTVTEGKVAVYCKKDTIRVTPNQQVVFDLKKRKLSKKEVNSAYHDFWFRDHLSFQSITLMELANILDELYSVKLNFKEKSLEQMKMTIAFNREEGVDALIKKVNIINEVQLIKTTNEMIEVNSVK